MINCEQTCEGACIQTVNGKSQPMLQKVVDERNGAKSRTEIIRYLNQDDPSISPGEDEHLTAPAPKADIPIVDPANITIRVDGGTLSLQECAQVRKSSEKERPERRVYESE